MLNWYIYKKKWKNIRLSFQEKNGKCFASKGVIDWVKAR